MGGINVDSGWKKVVSPIDYFMAIFVGMCLGITSLAYLFS